MNGLGSLGLREESEASWPTMNLIGFTESTNRTFQQVTNCDLKKSTNAFRGDLLVSVLVRILHYKNQVKHFC